MINFNHFNLYFIFVSDPQGSLLLDGFGIIDFCKALSDEGTRDAAWWLARRIVSRLPSALAILLKSEFVISIDFAIIFQSTCRRSCFIVMRAVLI